MQIAISGTAMPLSFLNGVMSFMGRSILSFAGEDQRRRHTIHHCHIEISVRRDFHHQFVSLVVTPRPRITSPG
jgi:hypothetical protein